MLTKKRFGLFTLVLFFMVGLVACSDDDQYEHLEDPTEPEMTAEGSEIHGAIHRIEYGDNVVYLFGSLHAGVPEWYPLADVVEEAMARADVFAFEFDFSMASYSPEEIAEIMGMMNGDHMLPGDQTLAELLPEEVYNDLVYHLPSYGVNYEDVYRQNPVALVMALQTDVTMELLNEAGVSALNSVDFYVLSVALEREASIIGLEPMMQQLRIAFAPDDEVLELAGFDAFTVEEIMQDALVGFGSREALIEAMGDEMNLSEYYATNNLVRINELSQPTAETMENAYGRYMIDVLMNFRSTYYANEIARLLQDTEEPTIFFVTVGLSHVMREGEHLTNIVEQLDLLGIEAVPIFE